jgi:hypothetical protein
MPSDSSTSSFCVRNVRSRMLCNAVSTWNQGSWIDRECIQYKKWKTKGCEATRALMSQSSCCLSHHVTC